ncbi:4Fe-4S binding protein [Melioribacteraceae bacterium 4301-Me]|uniref:4Fe-4S binding protein n=1 Tax=Pyranulibacter aquaticus TaxID=3163344 RepID=UPI0035955D7B
MKREFIRNTGKPIQGYRFLIQLSFLLLCIWIGIEFYLFISSLNKIGADYFNRPAGVEGFLPISALMSLYYFFMTGEIHPVHPAGFFIFIAILTVSFIYSKSFCSWLCPIGFISETIGDFGEKVIKKIFKRKIKLPSYIDYPLRSLKYLLLGFFIYAIFFAMSASAVKLFLDSEYNKAADLKMYYFFANISQFSLIVISSLFVLSIFIRNFWCRYLCPYGALLGLISFFSPTKIKRNPVSCIDCGLCAKACPSFIKVDKVKTVISDECSMCLSCIDVCPVKDTLDVKVNFTKKKISKKVVAFGVVAIYIAIISIAMISGNWKNKISKEEYSILNKNINILTHPTSTAEIRKMNELSSSSIKPK